MDIVPRIGRVERRHLLRLGRRSRDPATSLRFQIVAKLGLGRTSPEVDEALDVARSTVVKTAHRFAEEGIAGLYDKRRLNGRRKVGDGFRRRVAALLRRTPEDFGWRRPTWSRELLCLQMKRDGWPRVAVCTMGRTLARLGARLGRPKPVVLCPWPRDARERRLAELPPPPPPPPPPPSTWKKPAGIAAASVGVALLGVGSYFGARSIRLGNQAHAGCPNMVCDPAGWKALDDGRTAARVANGTLIAGGALAAAGVVLIILHAVGSSQPDEKRAALPLDVALGPGALSVRGAF